MLFRSRRYLDEVVPAKVQDNWLTQLMREKYPEPMTVLEWLRRPPRKRSRKTLDEEISKWLAIRAMRLGRTYRILREDSGQPVSNCPNGTR